MSLVEPREITLSPRQSESGVVALHAEPVDVLLVVLEHGARLVDGVDDARPRRLEELPPQPDVVHLGLVLAPEVGGNVDGEVAHGGKIDYSEIKVFLIMLTVSKCYFHMKLESLNKQNSHPFL